MPSNADYKRLNPTLRGGKIFIKKLRSEYQSEQSKERSELLSKIKKIVLQKDRIVKLSRKNLKRNFSPKNYSRSCCLKVIAGSVGNVKLNV